MIYWQWFTIQKKKQWCNFINQTDITVHQEGRETLVLYEGELKMTKCSSYLIHIFYSEKQDNCNNDRNTNNNNDSNDNNNNHNLQ